MDIREQRTLFVIRAKQGEEDFTALCEEFEISRPTGYLWLRRYDKEGLSGLEDRSRRPRSIPRQTSVEVEQEIVRLRQQRPDWGARKLHELLARTGIHLPVITIHRVLRRRGLVREQDRHAVARRRFERDLPNQLWQMDFKSPKGWDQTVGPLAVQDDCSRYVILLQQTGSNRREVVQLELMRAFEEAGVPEQMLMDHGVPWWNGQAARGWTQLAVWLMKQGIRLYFSGVNHPQTQGKVERLNGVVEQARRKRGLPPAEQRQAWLNELRYEYNYVRPHEALGMKTPASVWHPSERKYQPQPPEWEYSRGAELMRLNSAGQLHLEKRQWQISEALANETVSLVRLDQRVLVYFCETLVREVDLAEQRSTALALLPSLRSVRSAKADNTN